MKYLSPEKLLCALSKRVSLKDAYIAVFSNEKYILGIGIKDGKWNSDRMREDIKKLWLDILSTQEYKIRLHHSKVESMDISKNFRTEKRIKRKLGTKQIGGELCNFFVVQRNPLGDWIINYQ